MRNLKEIFDFPPVCNLMNYNLLLAPLQKKKKLREGNFHIYHFLTYSPLRNRFVATVEVLFKSFETSKRRRIQELQEAFLEYYRGIVLLRSFCTMNAQAVRKVASSYYIQFSRFWKNMIKTLERKSFLIVLQLSLPMKNSAHLKNFNKLSMKLLMFFHSLFSTAKKELLCKCLEFQLKGNLLENQFSEWDFIWVCNLKDE